jgi:PAS domain S-box-containing protein
MIINKWSFFLYFLASSLFVGGVFIGIYRLYEFTFVDELVLLLVFPVFYSAYHYSRFHYLLMLFIGLAFFFFVSYCIQEPEPPNVESIISACIFTISTSEMFHYLGISSRRFTQALRDLKEKNSELESEIIRRKQLEFEKNETDIRLKAIFDGAADAIFTKDAEFRYVTLNKSCRNLFGHPEEEIVGKTDFEVFSLEFAQHVREIDQRVLRGEIVRDEDRVSACGRFYAFQITKVPLVNDRGTIYGLCGIARDITEWKVADAALKESEERFRTIVETMQEGILLTDKNMDVAYANHNAEILFGLTLDETKHRPIYDFFPENLKPILMEKIANRKKGISERYDVQLQRKDGSIFNLFISATPLMDLQGSFAGILSILSDVTKFTDMVEERERLIADLQNALANIRKLSGLLPICSSCKKIRDDQGYWSQLEEYIFEHSEAEFTHSLCPECAKQLFPRYYKPNE